MARVTLINPPSEPLGAGNRRMTRVLYPPPPGGLASVAASLRAAGHSVRMLDLVVEPLAAAEVVARVRRHRADAVGFSVLGPALDATAEGMAALRAALPDVRLFAGNALPSEFPAWFLDRIPACDAVVVGEGEVTAVELVDAGVQTPVPGALLRGQDPATMAPRPQITDLDALPFPAWELLPYRRYRASPQLLFRSQPTLGVLQSRGCPWSCSFCAQNYLWPTVRQRSLESVVAEIRRGVVDLGVHRFGFYDSIFPLGRDMGEQLHRELERQGLLGKVRFFCETRVDLVWEDTFRWLARAGMHLVFLGIESPSASVLHGAGKLRKERMYDVHEAVATLRRVGLRSYGLFVLGLPGETEADREAMGRLSRSLPLDVASFGVFTPYAGAPAARGPDVSPESLTATNFDGDPALVAAQRRLMRRFYLRPGLIARHLWRREIALDRLLGGARALLEA